MVDLYITIGYLIIIIGSIFIIWLFAIEGVSRNIRKFKKKRLEIDKRISKLLDKLEKSRRLFFFKQSQDTREVFNFVIDTLKQRVNVPETKNRVYELLIYLQKQPFEYWWLTEKLNMIYASCQEAMDYNEKIRKYRKPLPKILKNLPHKQDDSKNDNQGVVKDGIQST